MNSLSTADLEIDSSDQAAADIIHEVFVTARTTRQFTDTAVPDAVLARAYDNAKWAPTAMNAQPMRLLVVRSEAARQRLAKHMSGKNRENTLAAPVSIVIAADLEFNKYFDLLAPHMAETARSWDSKPTVRENIAVPSTWLQLAYFIIALRAEGLGVGPMTGFDANGVTDEFFADSSWRALAVINVGYQNPNEVHHPRSGRFAFEDIAQNV